jgi:starch synthase (maltosyl-transferring)
VKQQATSQQQTTRQSRQATTPVGSPLGRIPVLDVGPVVDCGRWPAKAVVGEAVPITATVFREGHDAVAATAVLLTPDGAVHSSVRMEETAPGLDRYEAWVVPDAEGDWSFRVEGWGDPYGTWEHDAVIKVEADVDTELMLTEGALLLERAAGETGRSQDDVRVLRDAVHGLRDETRPPQARLAAGTSAAVHAVLARQPVRDFVTASATYTLRVQRELALFGSWYEFFPRSVGAHYDEATGRWTSGTLRTAAEALPRIAEMGFDVAYLTPVHPIGETNRKGRNNTLVPEPGDPGSPYAIGAADGGHDAIHAELGTFEDFDYFVSRAKDLGLEVALDLALQASPDHPWVKEHPEWFTTRADGTIAYAENPPKKYQDIYPVNFDNDPEGIYNESLRVVLHWVEHGVRIFRVDNPHTKPPNFWEWLIWKVKAEDPDVLFLAEAFTRPARLFGLARLGYTQSYTYFTWRTRKEELTEFALMHAERADECRPNYFVNTPDILHESLQTGGPSMFAIRATLASTMSPTWGVYSGYELFEWEPARPGSEEYQNSEKYALRPRDFTAALNEGRSLEPYLTRLNELRRAHPALQQLRNIDFHHTDSDQVIAYSKVDPASGDTVMVVCTLDPHHVQTANLSLDMEALGADWDDTLVMHDEISGATFHWGQFAFARLEPWRAVAHILRVERPTV